MGIPNTDTAHLDGNSSANTRQSVWKQHRVIYCTPQTLENDLVSRRLNPNAVVCIVVDEAHRATANYAYTNIVKYLNDHDCRFRVLALSATPGADQTRIQKVRSALKSCVSPR